MRQSPGVMRVFDAADVAGRAPPAVNALLPGLTAPDCDIFAGTVIRALGQPVAAVIARSPSQARDAAQLFDLDVEPFAAVPAVERAITHQWTTGDVDAAFAQADFIVRVEQKHARLAPFALEPRAALADWDESDQSLTVWLSTQTPHRARDDLASFLQMPKERIRVIAPDVGGAFGGKASIYPEDLIVALAAVTLRAPAKWTSSRSDDFLAATQGRGATTRAELALSKSGRFLGLKADLAFPLGHWLPYSALAPLNNAGRILPAPYKIAAVDVQGRAEMSNTAATNIYRGAGRPEATLLMERLTDEAARVTGIDPVKLRSMNVIGTADFPYATGTGAVIDSADFNRLLDIAVESSGYGELLKQCKARRRRGEICGIGIGLYAEPCGQGWESASVHIDDHGRIVAATGSTAQGQGRQTAFSQIVTEVLQVALEDVQVVCGDTAAVSTGIGALASRSTPIGGSALQLAAQEFLAKAQARAAMLLNSNDVIHIAGGFVSQRDTTIRLSWSDFATDQPDEKLRADVIYHVPAEAWSSGCVIAMISIDKDTGVLRIEKLSWADDAGPVINPMLVEGQLRGGMAQGIGEALMEQIVYDADGQMLTGSLMDYTLPRASTVPDVDLRKLETPTSANALGSKGVGEAGCIGVPATILNAAIDALRPIGVQTIDMPLTSAKIWQAMDAARKKNDAALKIT